MSALNEVISPYQKWGQREDICALERAWMKEKMQRSIDNMSQSRVSDETEKHLKKIDFAARRWKKSRIHCNKLIEQSRDDAISEIIQKTMQFLNTFMEHKNEIHASVDPEGMEAASKVFDLRWWNLYHSEKCDSSQETIQTKGP